MQWSVNRELGFLKLWKFLLFPLSFFLKQSDYQIVKCERGYFRSPDRGGFLSKKRRRNFSRSRMTFRVGPIERSMFVVCRNVFFWNRAT